MQAKPRPITSGSKHPELDHVLTMEDRTEARQVANAIKGEGTVKSMAQAALVLLDTHLPGAEFPRSLMMDTESIQELAGRLGSPAVAEYCSALTDQPPMQPVEADPAAQHPNLESVISFAD